MIWVVHLTEHFVKLHYALCVILARLVFIGDTRHGQLLSEYENNTVTFKRRLTVKSRYDSWSDVTESSVARSLSTHSKGNL